MVGAEKCFGFATVQDFPLPGKATSLNTMKDTIPISVGGPAPLSALRTEMKAQGLDGFVIPRADEHLGEYVPACAERLGWLTGFTGSAGLAIVLADKACLFVDGRYTLQARDEVDEALYDLGDLVAQAAGGAWPPGEWLATHLNKGQTLGFDPRLHTPGAASNLRKAATRAGAQVKAVKVNPIDTAWIDRPSAPIAPVTPHPDTFAGRCAADKRADVAAVLREAGHTAAVLTQPDSIAWLLNIRGNDVPYAPLPLSFAILHDSGRVDLFIATEKLSTTVHAHLGPDVTVHAPDALGKALDTVAAGGACVRLDPDVTPDWFFTRVKDAGGTPVHADDPCRRPKACKNAVELAGMRAAHLRDGVALTRFLAWLDAAPPGTVTEIAATEKLEFFRSSGTHFQGLSFPTISGAGSNGAIVHYRVTPDTDRLLEAGTLYLVDSGAQYLDGTTDVTRTVAIGAPNTEMRDRFTRVLKGHIALARAVFPVGTTGSQLDVLARMPLWNAGLDFDHGTGHGVGSYLSVHEGPQRISKVGNRVALEPGMVVSNEPGYYKRGAYGIRIENLVAVQPMSTPEGGDQDCLRFETLTLAPIDRRLIDASLLSADERAWLEGYHARVVEALTPLLDTDTTIWLTQATKPL